MYRRKFLMAAIVAGIAALAGPATSQAAFTITIHDGVHADVVFSTSGNLINDSAVMGNYTVTVTGFSNSPGFADSQVSNTAIAFTTTGPTAATTFTITAADDRFTNIAAGTLSNVHTFFAASTLNGTGVGISNLNGSPVAGSAINLAGTSSGTSDTTATVPTNPYEFGNTMTLNLNASNVTTRNRQANVEIDSSIRPVPAPAGLLLAATALPFCGLLRRRLRRPEATTVA